jgi:hypothetical protein
LFQYFLQKSFFRLITIAAVVAFVGIFAYALLLEGTIERTPANMEVPFKEMTGKPVVAGTSVDDALKVQHMSETEIGRLLQQIVAESLSLNASNYDSTSASVRKYFTDDAYRSYLDFLKQGNVKQMLSDQNLQSGAFAESDPLELNSGVFGASYKWLMEVPVTMSFVPRGSRGYENSAATPQNRRFVLRGQFARVKDSADPNAVKMEIWQISPARR